MPHIFREGSQQMNIPRNIVPGGKVWEKSPFRVGVSDFVF